jgi:predicted nucleic acid-binding protein
VDVLDTSVIIGMKRKDILAVAKRRVVAVSPFTVWELVCHLDEVRKDETPDQAFRRRKGTVVVLQSLEMLHDPFAQHAAAVGAAQLANPTRFEDREGARQIVNCVVGAKSLAALRREVLTRPDGAKVRFGDIAVRARQALEQEELRYIENARKMWGRVVSLSGLTNPSKLTDEHLWQWLSDMLAALRGSYEQDGVATEALLLNVCESMYPYFGYLFARLRTYCPDKKGVLAIQPNDTEDGYLCMHIRLFEDDVLVTGDGPTKQALQSALALWNTRVPHLPAKCRVMSKEQYAKAFVPAS